LYNENYLWKDGWGAYHQHLCDLCGCRYSHEHEHLDSHDHQDKGYCSNFKCDNFTGKTLKSKFIAFFDYPYDEYNGSVGFSDGCADIDYDAFVKSKIGYNPGDIVLDENGEIGEIVVPAEKTGLVAKSIPFVPVVKKLSPEE
jgi:hypothetical protein